MDRDRTGSEVTRIRHGQKTKKTDRRINERTEGQADRWRPDKTDTDMQKTEAPRWCTNPKPRHREDHIQPVLLDKEAGSQSSDTT